MMLLAIGFSFIFGLALGFQIALPIVLLVTKKISNDVYDKAVSDTLDRLKNGNDKKNN